MTGDFGVAFPLRLCLRSPPNVRPLHTRTGGTTGDAGSRDIKPGNILVNTQGRVKVAHFGLAKLLGEDATTASALTVTGFALGTPLYAAPEQTKPGAPVDHRADIYALGVMLYEMLTAEVPRGIFQEPSAKSGTLARWDGVIVRVMDAQPARRFGSGRGKREISRPARRCATVLKMKRRRFREIAYPPMSPFHSNDRAHPPYKTHLPGRRDPARRRKPALARRSAALPGNGTRPLRRNAAPPERGTRPAPQKRRLFSNGTVSRALEAVSLFIWDASPAAERGASGARDASLFLETASLFIWDTSRALRDGDAGADSQGFTQNPAVFAFHHSCSRSFETPSTLAGLSAKRESRESSQK